MATNGSDGTKVESKDIQSRTSHRRKVGLINLAKRKAKGVKKVVQFDSSGEPFGPVAVEMQRYVGVLAQQEVKISYESWEEVPQEVKDIIWERVNSAYEVNEDWKSGCLESANSKWQQWKSKLYQEHIFPNRENSAKLINPPPSSGILQEDWNRFVIYKMFKDLSKLNEEILSEEQREREMKNIYPQRLSRRGDAGLAEEVEEESCGDDDVDIASMRKKSRVAKNGDVEEGNFKEAAQRIDDCIRQKEEGEFQTQRWGDDLLTCALENRGRSRHVKGVGGYVDPTFKHLRVRRQHMKNEHLDEFMELKKNIVEHNEMISHLHDRLGKLEATIAKDKDKEEKERCSEKQPCHLDEDIGEKEDEVVFVEKVDVLQRRANSPDVVSAKNKKVQHQVVKERKVKCYNSLPPSLKVLYIHAENSLTNGQGIFIPFDYDIFGKPFEVFVHLEDIIPFCDLEPITGNCIVVYMWHLYLKLKENSALDRCRFVDPFDISYVPKASNDAQAHALADRFENLSSNQIVIVPCITREDWVLTVIDPHKKTISIFDPLSHQACEVSWKNIVNTAIFVFNAKLKKRGKKQPTWKIIKSPRQPDSKQCGFLVMRCMKEIIEELISSGSILLNSHFDNRIYSQEDIDEVRVDWANLVLHHI